jgi:hypothetical protein
VGAGPGAASAGPAGRPVTKGEGHLAERPRPRVMGDDVEGEPL